MENTLRRALKAAVFDKLNSLQILVHLSLYGNKTASLIDILSVLTLANLCH
jgi:hypothetical protein